ncbi:MAG TPA: HD domain-containing protein [Steroidobacteraceae bacterium]|nr:HD domain-containing protein [Steroidobacteraceae bacterium]
MSLGEEILAIYRSRGSAAYFGESVSMTEHGLQAAHFARSARAPDALVLAALLHDIGHLIAAVPDALEDWTSDAQHEQSGARWLAARFPPAVCEPVRLHVAAKRYLCATDRGYHARLSPASVHTLALQGGPMSPAEVAQFEAERFHRDAVWVRYCDDRGKVAGLETERLEDYLGLLDALAVTR